MPNQTQRPPVLARLHGSLTQYVLVIRDRIIVLTYAELCDLGDQIARERGTDYQSLVEAGVI